jgi:hypothetical protein
MKKRYFLAVLSFLLAAVVLACDTPDPFAVASGYIDQYADYTWALGLCSPYLSCATIDNEPGRDSLGYSYITCDCTFKTLAAATGTATSAVGFPQDLGGTDCVNGVCATEYWAGAWDIVSYDGQLPSYQCPADALCPSAVSSAQARPSLGSGFGQTTFPCSGGSPC